jgi:hypothetical protein
VVGGGGKKATARKEAAEDIWVDLSVRSGELRAKRTHVLSGARVTLEDTEVSQMKKKMSHGSRTGLGGTQRFSINFRQWDQRVTARLQSCAEVVTNESRPARSESGSEMDTSKAL